MLKRISQLNFKTIKKTFFVASLLLLFAVETTHADVRLKDITTLQGVRQNQLIGYGLVVGLDGTGDGSSNRFTIQSLATMLNNLGVGIDPNTVNVKNVAGVIVTAYLPPFARMGSKVDVLVSSLGDAKSLQGGTLLLTPLKGADGKVYAVSQGPVTIGGFSEESAGTKSSKNHPTVGKVPNGASIERELNFDFANIKNLSYSLNNPDFTTANRVVRAVDRLLGKNYAKAKDSGTIQIEIPEKYRENIVKLVSMVESAKIQPDFNAKVVVNERTGTVVVGEDVKISTVAVAHGSLTINIQPDVIISQPDALSEGDTIVYETPDVEVKEGEDNLAIIPNSASIGDLVKALNAIGVSPRDLIAVFQAIQAAGALQAELEII